MTVIVRGTKEDEITIPDRLMDELDLQDGEQVKTMIEGNTLRLTPMKRFLALRGILEDDEGFGEAQGLLEEEWHEWNRPS